MAPALEIFEPHILDVRLPSAVEAASTRDQILAGLQAPTNEKSLPTVLLYDEVGLNIYDKITTDAEEYYLFGCEEQILKKYASEIVGLMHSGSGGTESKENVIPGEVVIELGAGSLRKTSHILKQLARTVNPNATSIETPPITYYALDLEKKELDRTLKLTAEQLGDVLDGKVAARGMLGTYSDGLKFVRDGGLDDIRMNESSKGSHGATPVIGPKDIDHQDKSSPAISDVILDNIVRTPSLTPASSRSTSQCSSLLGDVPLYIMFLGSSLGNFDMKSAAAFLRSLPLRPGSSDRLLLGLDHDNDKDLIERAYNDRHGITRDFIMNGLKVAGRALGDEETFNDRAGDWSYVSLYNEEKCRHEAYYRSNRNQSTHIPSNDSEDSIAIPFSKDELVHIEYSYKYSTEEATALFSGANLRPIHRWTDDQGLYSLWLLERPFFDMPLIPTTGLEDKSPYAMPTLVEFQEQWKAWDSITLQMIPRPMLHKKPIDLRHKCLFYLGHIPAFLDIHLSRFLEEPHTEPVYYKDIFERGIDPNVDDPTKCHDHSEVPTEDEDWPTLEEILDFRDRVRMRLANLYSDFKSGKRVVTRRAARVLSMTLEHEQMHVETLLYMLIQVADGTPSGSQAPEGFAVPRWELLKESDEIDFRAFQAANDSTSVTLGPATITMGHDDKDTDDHLPFSAAHELGWDNENPSRTVEVKEFRIEWRPVSNGQYYQYWSKEGGEIPVSWIKIDDEIYVRTLYGPIRMEQAFHWPVVTSYDDLSTYAKVQGGRVPTEQELRLFLDTFCNGFLGGMNVGFRRWHPQGATAGGARDQGRGHNGGIWEWTSTVFDDYKGFSSSLLYPGYSSDFFDGEHMIVLGGSYATPPRLAQRRSFRNWYQHNYPYAWVGARIAYDV